MSFYDNLIDLYTKDMKAFYEYRDKCANCLTVVAKVTQEKLGIPKDKFFIHLSDEAGETSRNSHVVTPLDLELEDGYFTVTHSLNVAYRNGIAPQIDLLYKVGVKAKGDDYELKLGDKVIGGVYGSHLESSLDGYLTSLKELLRKTIENRYFDRLQKGGSLPVGFKIRKIEKGGE